MGRRVGGGREKECVREGKRGSRPLLTSEQDLGLNRFHARLQGQTACCFLMGVKSFVGRDGGVSLLPPLLQADNFCFIHLAPAVDLCPSPIGFRHLLPRTYWSGK